jgi:type IV fimbrial biogenesis protein FimT
MRYVRGFTLLEFLIALAIGSIVAAIAVPNFSTMLANARRSATLEQFVAAVQLARTQALTSGHNVVICASRDQATCAPATSWSRSWIVFVNLDDKPGQRDVAREPLLQVFEAARGQTLSASIAGGEDFWQMRPLGIRSTNGTLTVCDRRGAAAARAVVIGIMGRPYVSTTDGSKRPLACPQII